MYSYSDFFNLAREHGFESFTALQNKAFHSSYISDSDKNLFVIGETSSGKTLIPQLLYEMAVITAKKEDKPNPKMLFVVPYRALAAQKKREFDLFYESYELSIVQSTGEFRDSDNDIQHGRVDVAIMITEKAFHFQSNIEDFLSKYDFLVLDEVGLINSEDRGIYYDLLFTWGVRNHCSSKRPRLIALGTPFYDWRTYIEHYCLGSIVVDDERPISLVHNTILFDSDKIKYVDGKCTFLSHGQIMTEAKLIKLEQKEYEVCCPEQQTPCPVGTLSRKDHTMLCPKIDRPCMYPLFITKDSVQRFILLKICSYHLLQGHQILIFSNNRKDVVDTCLFLYRELKKMPDLVEMFPAPPSPEECRREILEACGLDADDVYGILENVGEIESKTECYQALHSGFAFHSAALPNELRSFVEDKLLFSREMKIVCSTETLAFGVNSTVDVVIIKNVMKQDSMITRNEYQNYVGRAGRLRPGTEVGQIKGTVYTLLNTKQQIEWDKVRSEPPKRLKSVFYSDYDEKLPFFLLNLIQKSRDGVSFKELLDYVKLMPSDDMESEESLRNRISDAIAFLLSKKLMEKKKAPVGRGRSMTEVTYLLTRLGTQMQGYVLDKNDFQLLCNAVNKYVKGYLDIESDRTELFYSLLRTKKAASALKNAFKNVKGKLPLDKLCEYICSYSKTSETNPSWRSDEDSKNLYVLGAVLAWCDGESTRSIYSRFGVHYTLLNRLSEQISHLVEIGRGFIEVFVEQRCREFNEQWKNLTGKEQGNLDLKVLNEKCEMIIADAEKLAVSLYYGINLTIHGELMEYLKGTDHEGQNLRERYAIKTFNPTSAKEFRRIVYAYSFFERKLPQEWKNAEKRDNYLSLRRQHYQTIQKIGSPLVTRFFEGRFGDAFNDIIDGRK